MTTPEVIFLGGTQNAVRDWTDTNDTPGDKHDTDPVCRHHSG